MTFEEMDKEMFNEMTKLNVAMRTWRSVNSSFNIAPCAHQNYIYFLDWVKFTLMFFLVIRVWAITSDTDPDATNTFGKWLNEGSLKSNVDNALWRNAKKQYNNLLVSRAYTSMEKIRTSLYAHNLDSKNDIPNLPNKSFRDLFGLIEELQSIYDKAALSGMCASTDWSLPLQTNIERSISHMMNALEAANHRDKLHQRLIDHDAALKAANPELY